MTTTTEKQYKWDHPEEWLLEAVESGSIDAKQALRRILWSPALDSDTIQDIFQRDMDMDGYFIPRRDWMEENVNPEHFHTCANCEEVYFEPAQGTCMYSEDRTHTPDEASPLTLNDVIEFLDDGYTDAELDELGEENNWW